MDKVEYEAHMHYDKLILKGWQKQRFSPRKIKYRGSGPCKLVVLNVGIVMECCSADPGANLFLNPEESGPIVFS